MTKSNLLLALFIFLFTIAGFFLGLIVARFLVPKEAGLAAGAIALGYGVAGMVVALTLGIIVPRFLSSKSLKIASIVFGLFNLAVIGWVATRISKEQATQSPVLTNKPTTQPAAPVVSPDTSTITPQAE